MFIDAISNLDEHNLKFFCTRSVAGALPLGNISEIFIFESTMADGSKYNGILEK